MTENLKSCPFCGGKPHFENEGSDYGFYAVCSRCGCWTGALRTKDDSLKRWNNRPIEDDLDKKNGCLIGTCHDLHDIVEEFRAECDQKDLEIKRLREALNEIKKTVEDAQDTVYPFHLALDSKDAVYILDIAKEALKGDDE